MASGNSFNVAPVKEAEKLPYPTNSIREISDTFVSFWTNRKNKFKSGTGRIRLRKSKSNDANEDDGASAMDFEVGLVNHNQIIKPGSNHQPQGHHHGFVNTVLTAYNKHHPLVLCPDDFWLLISLAVSKFLGSNEEMAEKYRDTFVEHEGKKELVVRGEPFRIAPKSPKANKDGWPMFVDAICALVKENTKTDISDIMTTPFTTSGSVEKCVMGVTLMEAMKNYFSYKYLMCCGIPQITLEGTADDYKSIIQRMDKLGKILPDLEWFVVRARSHMEKILASVEGKVDEEFWRTMVLHIREGSGGQVRFTGWIADFFPNVTPEGRKWRQMDLDDCDAPAVTQTEFKLEDQLYTMKMYSMKLVAGFLGVAVDEKRGNALRPAIGWMTYYTGEEPL